MPRPPAPPQGDVPLAAMRGARCMVPAGKHRQLASVYDAASGLLSIRPVALPRDMDPASMRQARLLVQTLLVQPPVPRRPALRP